MVRLQACVAGHGRGRLYFDARNSPHWVPPSIEDTRDRVFLSRMLEPLPKAMSTVLEPTLDDVVASARRVDGDCPPLHTSALAARINILSSMMLNSRDGVQRPAMSELRSLTSCHPPTAIVAAGGHRALCAVIQKSAAALRRAQRAGGTGESISEASATEHFEHLHHAFSSLSAVTAGDQASPPAWSIQADALPTIREGMDALAHHELNRVLRSASSGGMRIAALRAGAALYDVLFQQLLLDSTDLSAAEGLGYSLPLPPPGSRLGWVDGAGLSRKLPILIDHGVPLLPRQRHGQLGHAADAPPSPAPPSTAAWPGPSVRRHALPSRPTPLIARSGVHSPRTTPEAPLSARLVRSPRTPQGEGLSGTGGCVHGQPPLLDGQGLPQREVTEEQAPPWASRSLHPPVSARAHESHGAARPKSVTFLPEVPH